MATVPAEMPAPPTAAAPFCLQLGLVAAFKEVAPGLTLGASGSIPDADFGKVNNPPALLACFLAGQVG